MSFADVLIAWRESGRSEQAELVERACAIFNERYGKILINIDTDIFINDLQRERLLNQLLTVNPTSITAVESKILSFCQSHQGFGPEIRIQENLVLGHIMPRAKLQKRLEIHTQESGFVLGASAATVASLLRKDYQNQKRMIRFVYFSDFHMWSFFSDRSPADPFHVVSIKSDALRRRLGLGHLGPSEELLYFAHMLRPDQKAKVPTAFDAGLNTYFRPGGRTQPLTGRRGVSEAVHPPILGNQITCRIQEAI